MSLVSSFVEHIPHPDRLHIEVGQNIIHVKGSYLDYVINAFQNIGIK